MISKFLREVELRLKQIPQRFHNTMKGREGQLANRALDRLTREPGRPIYPLRWASERQRRAFFATRGFGRGIPTRRSGELLEGWQVIYEEIGEESGAIILTNDDPSVEFVQGDRAQPFHLDTGWVQIDDVGDDFNRESGDQAVEIWFQVTEGVLEAGA